MCSPRLLAGLFLTVKLEYVHALSIPFGNYIIICVRGGAHHIQDTLVIR